MPSKQKPSNGRQPLYVAMRPDLADLKRRGDHFAHPRVLVGHRYGDSGVDYFMGEFTVDFQVNLRPAPDDTATRDGHAYGGSVGLRLDQVVEASKVIARALAKARALAPDQRDEFHLFIVGLRGCGYKEAVMTNGFDQIAFMR